MGQGQDAQTRFWIRKQNSLGNEIDYRLIEAAYRVWNRARLVVIRYLADDSEAAELLEIAVESASRTMANQNRIECVDAYLLRSVAREALRCLRKRQKISYVDNRSLERLAGPVSSDLEAILDEKRRIELIRACMDQTCLRMFDLRVLGHSWRSIAQEMGYASAHTAEVQFDKRLNQALKRMQMHHGSRTKSPLSRDSDE